MRPELTVIGGGPAGLAAATAASDAGVSTTLIDEQEYLGGQYLRQPRGPARRGVADRSARAGADAIAALDVAGVKSLVGATAYAARAGRIDVELDGGARTLNSAILVACGATERVVPIPGWTLPGVVTCGAAQAMIKMHGEPVGRRVLVAGSGPFLLPVSAALVKAGAEVAAVVEASRLGPRAVAAACSSPDVLREATGHLWALAAARSRLRAGWGVVRIDQRPGGLRATIGRLDARGALIDGGPREVIECDAVCLSDGFVPAVALAELGGAELRFLPGSRTWAVDADQLTGETAGAQVWAAGACVSPWSGARLSTARGVLAGQAAATELTGGEVQGASRMLRRTEAFARRLDRIFPTRSAWYGRTSDDVIVCRCEDVTAGTIRRAAEVSADVNAVKRMTRAGMGLCQGRTCQNCVAELVADTGGVSVDRVGRFSARVPNRPVRLETIARALDPTSGADCGG